MAELTRQYLGYVEMMRRTQLELAAEYLLMAAVLIEIKSRLLLPRPPAPPGDGGRGPARRARAPAARIRANEAGRAGARRAAARRARLRDGARLVRPRSRRAPARRRARRSAGGMGGPDCARARQPPSSGHARAALGALRDEPAAEAAASRRASSNSRRCSPRMRTSRTSSSRSSRCSSSSREQLISVAQAEPYAPIYAQLRARERRSRSPRMPQSTRRRPATPIDDRRHPAATMSELERIEGVLEAALLVAGEPVPAAQLAKLFEPRADRRHRAQRCSTSSRSDWSARKVELVQVASRLALPGPARRAAVISTGSRRKSRRAIRAR